MHDRGFNTSIFNLLIEDYGWRASREAVCNYRAELFSFMTAPISGTLRGKSPIQVSASKSTAYKTKSYAGAVQNLNLTGRLIALKGATDLRDCNGDSPPQIPVGPENGWQSGRSHQQFRSWLDP